MSIPYIVEERVENMVAHTGGMPTLRLARFLNLKPCLGETLDHVPSVPTLLKPKSCNAEKSLPDVHFNGWMWPQKRWKEWVDQLSPIYGHVWKKAGVYDAIVVSTYKFIRDGEFILALVDFWCQDTNTFVFSWGEATVTLEDLFIIGGFSVLGEPANLPLTEELLEIEERLIKEHKKCYSTRSRKPSYGEWFERFMGSDDDLEHVAFLCLWLTRYVFPTKPKGTIAKHLFSIAIHLSKGTRIAVAPEGYESDEVPLSTWAPFQILQLWAWERFSCSRPTPNPLNFGEPRAARWHEVKSISKFDSVLVDINSPDEFLWRPYSSVLNNGRLPLFYKDEDEWVIVSPDVHDELLAFTRFIVPCELVGLDCIEQYLPHRVGMQFGMDQDIPCHFTRANANWKTAWDTYQNTFSVSTCIYIPPRLFESDVTVRYFDWWNEPNSPKHGDTDGVSFDPMSSLVLDAFPDGYTSPALGVPCQGSDELESSSDDDEMTISEWLKHQQGRVVKEGEARSGGYISNAQVLSSSSTTKRSIGMKDPILTITDADLHHKAPIEDNNTKSGDSAGFCSEMCHPEIVGDTHELIIPGLELEDRIGRLEEIVDKLRVVFGARKKKSGQGTSNAKG
ncbi:hypothetical protein ACHQM5_030367 [Ranunculus cassubicifolius]